MAGLGTNQHFVVCVSNWVPMFWRLHSASSRNGAQTARIGSFRPDQDQNQDAVSGRGPTRSAQDCRTDTITASPLGVPGSSTHLFLSLQDETTAFPPNIPCLHLSPLPISISPVGSPPPNPPLHVHYCVCAMASSTWTRIPRVKPAGQPVFSPIYLLSDVLPCDPGDSPVGRKQECRTL
jgi:hypothetical protein